MAKKHTHRTPATAAVNHHAPDVVSHVKDVNITYVPYAKTHMKKTAAGITTTTENTGKPRTPTRQKQTTLNDAAIADKTMTTTTTYTHAASAKRARAAAARAPSNGLFFARIRNAPGALPRTTIRI